MKESFEFGILYAVAAFDGNFQLRIKDELVTVYKSSTFENVLDLVSEDGWRIVKVFDSYTTYLQRRVE